MDPAIFTALAEPNRRRILEFVGDSPRTVGEVAGALELRQPQATKHLQALAEAGLVTVHPLGRRKLYALQREAFGALRDWAAAIADARDGDVVVADYAAAIARERERFDAGDLAPRLLHVEHELPATPTAVWDWWTQARRVREWWAPVGFSVVDATVEARLGGALRIVMAEADGVRYPAEGRFTRVDRPTELGFELAPLGPGGAPMFRSALSVVLTPSAERGRTHVRLTAVTTDLTPGSEPALAGMGIGWQQTLARLAVAIAR